PVSRWAPAARDRGAAGRSGIRTVSRCPPRAGRRGPAPPPSRLPPPLERPAPPARPGVPAGSGSGGCGDIPIHFSSAATTRRPRHAQSAQRPVVHRPAVDNGVTQSDLMTSRISRAVSLGVLPTLTPTASRAAFLASAVPDEPEMIAPACPIVLPGGAVNPAMYPTTGLVT